jgi:hypothetical protein
MDIGRDCRSKRRLVALGVAGFAGVVVVVALLLWLRWPGQPSIIVVSHGRLTNASGAVLFKVAVTNKSHDSMAFIVARYQAFKFASGPVTNMMSATNFILKPGGGQAVVVDAPLGPTNTWVAVLQRRERGRREMYLRSIGYRYRLCNIYANWEEVQRIELNKAEGH